jgi:hypothetical protein
VREVANSIWQMFCCRADHWQAFSLAVWQKACVASSICGCDNNEGLNEPAGVGKKQALKQAVAKIQRNSFEPYVLEHRADVLSGASWKRIFSKSGMTVPEVDVMRADSMVVVESEGEQCCAEETGRDADDEQSCVEETGRCANFTAWLSGSCF